MTDEVELDDQTNQRLLSELYDAFERLAAIGREFEQATTDGGKRQNALDYLRAFVAYLEHLRVQRVLDGKTAMQALTVPQALVGDIVNLCERRQTVLLERPKGGRGRRPQPIQHETALAWASAAIDYLVEEGNNELAAAQRVMRAIKKQKLALYRASPASLLDYRADIRSGRRLPKEIKEQYHEARKIIWNVAASKGFDAALMHVLYVIGPLCGKKQASPEEV